jgi:hypothetical protein
MHKKFMWTCVFISLGHAQRHGVTGLYGILYLTFKELTDYSLKEHHFVLSTMCEVSHFSFNQHLLLSLFHYSHSSGNEEAAK